MKWNVTSWSNTSTQTSRAVWTIKSIIYYLINSLYSFMSIVLPCDD